MEHGPLGQHGVTVTELVLVDINREPDHVLILHQITTVKTKFVETVEIMRNNDVIHNIAHVRPYLPA